MQKYINKYIRNKNGHMIGCVIASKKTAENVLPVVSIGVSLCKKTDKFDKNKAIAIAYTRASMMANGIRNQICPLSVRNDVTEMIDRASRYFKVHPDEIIYPQK